MSQANVNRVRFPVKRLLIVTVLSLLIGVLRYGNVRFIRRIQTVGTILCRSCDATAAYNGTDETRNKTIWKIQCPSDVRGPFSHGFHDQTLGRKTGRKSIFKILFDVKPGGWWAPDDCQPIHEPVAVIVPYRGRELHLKSYVPYIHALLKQQKVPHLIVTVEQADNEDFNRGILFNVGVLNTPAWINCFILSDIDMLPDRLENTFKCSHECPKSLVTGISRSNYVPLDMYHNFGGIVALTREQYYRVNGFGTFFWGWGEEDNDLYRRSLHFYKRICRVPYKVGLFTHLSHTRKESGRADALRIITIRAVKYNFSDDGLRNTAAQCNVEKIDFRRLRTAISVTCVRPPESEIEKFLRVTIRHSNKSDYIGAI